jgi:hypothetical protein
VSRTSIRPDYQSPVGESFNLLRRAVTLDAKEKATVSVAYSIITLSNDLRVDGIDLDAEEFWHADKYAVQWNGNSWSSRYQTHLWVRVR